MTSEPFGRLALAAPAKVNLGLRVVGRRSDGYHLLESLFAPLDLADEIELEVAQASGAEACVALELIGSGAPAGSENLAARAARAFLDASGLALDVRIRLRKSVPAGAGLGGGSSDAAAVLRGLHQLAPGALSAAELSALALRLGADVPFFLDPRPAMVRGIGEQVEVEEGLPELALVLANPGVSLATAAVYAEYDRLAAALTRAPSRPTLPPLASRGSLVDGPLAFARWLGDGRLRNDLEAAAVRLCPEIRVISDRLEAAGAIAVGMSGSGATSFGLFPDLATATVSLERAAFESPCWARVAATAGSR